MAFHYNGPISRTPDLRACDDTVGVADVPLWRDSDCDPCKATVEGMVIERLQPGGEPMVIVAVEPQRFARDYLGATEPETTWALWSNLDTKWRPQS